MISTETALARLFDLVAPLGTEEVALASAGGRVLAADIVATRAQPPFAASAMDGYAVRAADLRQGASLRVIGEAPAGQAFAGAVRDGEAVRIFTGAPLPTGADTILIQEDTETGPDGLRILDVPEPGAHIRPAGGDFLPGASLPAPRRLGPGDIALAAAMNVPRLTVRRRPVISLIATGDELVQPGEDPRPDQIVASNTFGLKIMLEAAGAECRLLPIARDTADSLRAVFDLASGSDLIVSVGGASVGDYDLVGQVAAELGMERAFYKVAMRPGKPLMAGRLGAAPLVGLPGNPVSAMVCGYIFLMPMLDVLLGLPQQAVRREAARLGPALGKNGPREHYMRARLEGDTVTPFGNQDSSLLSILSRANVLLVRPPHDPPRDPGATMEIVRLPFVDDVPELI
ncbi:MAG: gephyrin-like molybdotransferase Glp [Pseudomonadota bacterium]